MILAIDPGKKESAYVLWGEGKILDKGIEANDAILRMLSVDKDAMGDGQVLVIEMIQCFGMPVGADVLETCVWIGRFVQEWMPQKSALVYRKNIKMHFCQSYRAKDANIRRALIDRFGEPGRKANPGLLHGVRKDEWAALAVALYYEDTTEHK